MKVTFKVKGQGSGEKQINNFISILISGHCFCMNTHIIIHGEQVETFKVVVQTHLTCKVLHALVLMC